MVMESENDHCDEAQSAQMPSATTEMPSQFLRSLQHGCPADANRGDEIKKQEIHSAASQWLDNLDPVDCAKQRLVTFRRRHLDLTNEQRQAVQELLKGALPERISNSFEASIVSDMQIVIDGDSWNGEPFPKHWLRAWLKWDEPFCNNKVRGKSEQKRRANHQWYFGCQPCDDAPAPIYEGFPDPDHVSPAVAEAPCESHMKPNSSSAEPCIGDTAHRAWGQTLDAVAELTEADVERVAVVEGLQRCSEDNLTICTLSSKDTIPLGTDLDPCNRYDNRWAASKVRGNLHGQLLVQCNLGCRVIDAENVGFSYGAEVLHAERRYDAEGVRRAVDHFQRDGIEVVLVGKRAELMKQFRGIDGVQVVIADSTDDTIIIKQAHSRNCPVVSRDGFAKWKSDMRIAREVRRWLQESAELQVRFSWSQQGQFVPDFDLPRPVLRPSASVDDAHEAAPDERSGSWKCDQCHTIVSSGSWSEWNKWRNQWYCKACWSTWKA